MSTLSTNEIDSKRVKLILKFLERVNQNSHQIEQVEFISDDAIRVNWFQDNERDNISCSFSNLYHFDRQSKMIGNKINDFPLQIQTNIQSTSPENTNKVIVQQVQDKAKQKQYQVLEVYRSEDVISQINLSDYHENILDDPSVSSKISWNKLETKFLYMAQVKKKETKTYFEVEEDKDLEDVNRNYQYNQDFGEGMSDITQIHLFEYDIERNTLCNIQIPENIFPCYPQYLDDKGDQIILQGYKIHPEFKYSIQVLNRQVNIYHLFSLQRKQLFPKQNKGEVNDMKEDKKTEYKIISQDQVCLKPIVSYDGKKIAYYGSPLNPSHLNYLALKVINTTDWSIEEILSIKNENLADKNEFMGVCNYGKDLRNSFWLNDSKHYTFSSLIGPSVNSYIVNTETKEISSFKENKMLSQEFQVIHYNPRHNALFATYVNLTEPKCLAYLSNLNLNQDVQQITNNTKWQYINLTQGKASIFPSLRDFALKNVEEQVIKSGESTGCLLKIKYLDKEGLPQELLNLFNNNEILNPLNYKDEERPLIVDIHGGPHANYGGEFTLANIYYLLQGYNILAPNFTGSGGFGQDFINKLLTNIGDIDAKEIIDMVDQIVQKKLCNPKKIIIAGGSYGGYLAPILASKYSDKFICCVISNAVLNIPFTINISDLPDWSMAESLGKNMNWNLNGNDYKRMFELSPMSMINKVPTLNIASAKDKRVPYQQSLAYHSQNIFNGNSIETYIFDDQGHALVDQVHPIFGALIKQITFIEKQILKQHLRS